MSPLKLAANDNFACLFANARNSNATYLQFKAVSLDGDDLQYGQLLYELLGFLTDQAGPMHVPARAFQVQAVDKGTCTGRL